MHAPDFSLPNQDGKTLTLSEHKGNWIVVYFYPRDNTPGCTVEACSFRDTLSKLTELGVVVFGISKDTVKSHKKFSDQFNLSFQLLSDTTTDTIKAYGAWGKKKFMGREYEGILRNTYLIDPTGLIRKTYEKVTPLNHAEEIAKDVAQFQTEENR